LPFAGDLLTNVGVPDPSLLILIPAYNEESRIEPTLRNYAQFFGANYAGEFRLVVVLNGCRDNTVGVVQRVARDFPCVRFLDFHTPIGKGGALIEGLKLAAFGEFVGYVDADGATPPDALLKLVRLLDRADCVIGSRWLPGAVLHVEQNSRRRFASRVFHLLVQVLFRMNVRDTQCGAKVMRREAVEKIHSSLRIADMAFDINLLYSLHRAGYHILEVPTEWTDKIGSKVTLFRTSLVMFLSVVRIRIIYWPRLYRLLRPLRPLEGWVYGKLRAPQPRPGPRNDSPKSKVQSPKSSGQ